MEERRASHDGIADALAYRGYAGRTGNASGSIRSTRAGREIRRGWTHKRDDRGAARTEYPKASDGSACVPGIRRRCKHMGPAGTGRDAHVSNPWTGERCHTRTVSPAIRGAVFDLLERGLSRKDRPIRFVPVRRLDAEEIVDEEVIAFTLPVRSAGRMLHSGNQQKVESLAGF